MLLKLTIFVKGPEARVKKIQEGGNIAKEIDKWITDMSDFHKSKPPPTVNYRNTMPDIDHLMQVSFISGRKGTLNK